jgi:UDP-glucuronate 4-epimerase
METKIGLRMLFLTGLTVVCLLLASLSTSPAAVAEAVQVAFTHKESNIETRRSLAHGSSVLVTGGAGFVGYHLCLRLHRDGVRVVALDNFDPYYSTALKRARQAKLVAKGIEVIEADMCDDARLAQIFQQAPGPFTHVASLAAQAGVRFSLVRPQAYTRANVQCFLSLLEALRHIPATSRPQLVYASSSSVYGSNTKTPFSESDRTDSPNSLYAATKKTNEQLAHVYHNLYGLRVTGLRFFTVYGPWGRPDMAYFSFTHRISSGRPIEVYGYGTPQRDFTYIDDVVDGIVGALVLGADEEIFNLGNHRTESLGRFIAVLERELGVTANKTMVGMSPGDVQATYADVQRAAEMIGYSPHTSIDEGLHRFVQWYRSDEFKPEYAEQGEWIRPSKAG